ncbi:Cys-tRNA(Pro) deacylase [Pseudoalteromonas sp. NBT06-2]|uniref:Cys-tRNA(Pro) deacylase n=1 Tax=Pseudoalteromonas sp. NBT06-2 TaxID=2025950 RepID=UPI000BA7A1CC|nr:Cys-tRNA(Pro) deacylase [Pseudoalteromonas sp. NBT06-2]PAJ76107.1 Cys-tRNA(Pro) deacylase [Pseudoalteromonas sp. NBT06-2]
MTPAIVYLKKQKVTFDIHQYQHEVDAQSFGLEAAQKLGVDQAKIYKTIVLETDQQNLVVAIVPVKNQVNLKKLAKVCKVKKVIMADKAKVQASTGYILGGVSPLGQKKRLATYMNESALEHQQIYISAGRRGLEVSLAASDLAQLLQASFCDLV